MTDPKYLVGNATSHMKPNSKFPIIGYKAKNGYKISGTIYFATGWKFFNKLVMGFYKENGQEIFAIIPFKAFAKKSQSICVGSTLQTISMQSINTVSLRLENYLIPNEDVVVEWPSQFFYKQYSQFPPFAYTLGIALEALDLVETSSALKKHGNLLSQYNVLKKNLQECRKQIRKYPQKISNEILFARIIEISWRCVQFAILLSGGLGLLINHKVQRLYREIVVWFIPKACPSVIATWLDKK